jgi:hypothetical protein
MKVVALFISIHPACNLFPGRVQWGEVYTLLRNPNHKHNQSPVVEWVSRGVGMSSSLRLCSLMTQES